VVPHASSSPSRSRKILCWAPYNQWALHGLWELTLLQAAQLRGAAVDYVMCDGVFRSCDLYWQAENPRHPLACTQCQAEASGLGAHMRMPFRWLGRWLAPEDFRAAARFAASLPPEGLPEAVFGDWPIGEWVRSSVFSDQRTCEIDLEEPMLRESYRRYVESGLLACFGLSRLLDEGEPDLFFVFNGRQSSTRIGLELARRRRIRTLCHERGRLHESLQLYENGNALSLELIRDIQDKWGEIPLVREELERIARVLHEHVWGRNHSLEPFSPAPVEPREKIAADLGLQPDRPVWLLFSTSFHEESAARGRAFARQIDWIRASVAYAAAHPQIDLVLRPHPNTRETMASGRIQPELAEFRELGAAAPPNVRVVAPDSPISSTSLIELASAALTYNSTIGVECACAGKPVVVSCDSLVSDLPFVHTVRHASGYASALERLLRLPPRHVDPEIRRRAYRFAYGLYLRFNIPFPLVKMPTPRTGALAYASLDDLRPGCDASLDRIMRILLDAEPVCVPPGPEELARSETDELEFFATENPLAALQTR
jgi:hypothetical protein